MTEKTLPAQAQWQPGTIFTVGHSTLPIDRFVALLQAYAIECVVDVRTVPKSRRNPQFTAAELGASLRAAGIGYEGMPDLGGLRRPRKDSTNTGWRNENFRGYADHMQTEAFRAALDRLIAASRDQRVAIMCAEAVPWRCHRSLVADALLARGIDSVEILSPTNWRLHALTPFAHVHDAQVTYPPEQGSLL